MGAGTGREEFLHLRQFLLQRFRVQQAAHQLEAQIDQPGVQHIGFAVVADIRDAAFAIRVEDLGTIHAQLARKPQQQRDLLQRRVVAAGVHR